MKSKPISATLDEKPLLNSKACRELGDRICGLREKWLTWNPERPYYTMFGGIALYGNPGGLTVKQYLSDAHRFNPVLKECFSDVYQTVFSRLEKILGAPVIPHAEFALPGFIIYLANNGIFGPLGPPHFDVQQRKLDWSKVDGPDLGDAVSFTLPITVPSCGTGIDCWNANYMDLVTRSNGQIEELLQGGVRKFFPYSPGTLFVMKGLLAHQVPQMSGFTEGDARITLQGHAVRTRRGWAVYF